MTLNPQQLRRLGTVAVFFCISLIASCTSPPVREPAIDPDKARAEIARRIAPTVKNRESWAIDIFAAFEALSVRPTSENICAVIAVTEQESTFQASPPVPGLPAIARREIDARAARYKIPKFLVDAALSVESPNGKSYRERIEKVGTEAELSDIFADFIGMVPLGERLFGSFNPVRTGGPMQVSITYAEQHARQKRYPYPMSGSVRDEVFSRRGGMYFGIAHLLDYPVSYPGMVFRFADFNAGHYASRNAAFQDAVSKLSKTKLALDGDLLIGGSNEPSQTERAVRSLAGEIDMDNRAIRRDLELGGEQSFEDSELFKRVFALADQRLKGSVPRALVPSIRLESPKITRKLTTGWFAGRVDDRYQKCLARGRAS
ncbi:DUF1615 domain-containing protein [Steroidobacter cummioxidans]|uniref:DUF1615 domain-containing protein n=1 Tax=Steroidobacter cummioxidans TaxID=1803913 RepID=UPI000E30D03D|nr:DUF1615 domain-containing protein [Steroidobacter cummioxidans]